MSVTQYTPSSSQIVHEARVDFRQRVIQSMVHIVQYDKSLPIIAVELYSNGQKWVLPSDANVKIRWGKRDHTYVYLDVLGCNEDRTIVYFEIVEQMTVFYGEHNPVLEVIIGQSVACSSYIPFYIDRNPIQRGDIESEVVPSVVERLEAEIRSKQNILVSGTNIKTINGQSILGSGNLTVSVDLSNYYTKSETDTLLGAKQATLVSGTNIKTVNNTSLLGSGNITIDKSSIGLGNVDNTSDLSKPISTATQTALNSKQATLVSGTNIKTINGQSILGSGNIAISTDLSNYYTKSETDDLLSAKQATLVSGTNIKTINSQSLLGSGNLSIKEGATIVRSSSNFSVDRDAIIAAWPNVVYIISNGAIDVYFVPYSIFAGNYTMNAGVAGERKHTITFMSSSTSYTETNKAILTNPMTSENDIIVGGSAGSPVRGTLKTINNVSLLGSGDITIDKTSLGLGNVDNTADLDKPVSTATQTALNAKQATLVSGTNIKTINGESILGSGNITVGGGGDLSNYYTKSETDTLLGAKQATLTSGTNIKTINNQSILGSGNLDISSGMQNPMTTAGDIIVGGTSGAPSRLAKGSNNQLLGVNSSGNIGYLNGIPYLTTAPSSANTDGDLKFVVMTEEPATRYDGYVYIIVETPASGYSGSILSYADGNFSGGTRIKFDTAPTSADDYDSYTSFNNATVNGSTSYSNKTKVYVWDGYVTINNVVTAGGSGYSNAVEITLDGDYDINLAYGQQSG